MDLLKSNYSSSDIKRLIHTYINKRKQNGDTIIIEFLMSQNKGSSLGSGLGNYLSPEILYRSHISPKRKIKDITDDEINILTENIKRTLKLAFYRNSIGYMSNIVKFAKERENVEKTGKYPQYLKDVKLKKNDVFEFFVYQQKKDPLNNDVKIDLLMKDRKTYWVPLIQK